MAEVEGTRNEVVVDAETEFIALMEETGNEWELFKENVRPLKRGRNVGLLNQSLKAHTQNQLKATLLETRRKLIQAIDDYQGDDPLLPWLECIKWVQEAFPSGGDSSGLVVIYEQCVRTFWHLDQYKDDQRYLKVWLEYAENCVDAEVIYNFLDSNKIGEKLAVFYIVYALYMESKSKMKAANDVFNLGLTRSAQPIEKLQDTYKKFLMRSMRRPAYVEEKPEDSHFPSRSFGTVLGDAENRIRTAESSGLGDKKVNPDRKQNAPLAIFKDKKSNKMMGHQPDVKMSDLNPWRTLGTRDERNKENTAAPSKWTSHKIPTRSVPRGMASTPCIEVFVDEECAEDKSHSQGEKPLLLQLRSGDDSIDTKKDSELLREHPLRNFPLNSLPR